MGLECGGNPSGMRGVETLRVRGYGHDRLGPMAETCGSTVGFAPVGAGPRFSGSACERDRARRGIYSRRRTWGSEGTPETIGSCGSPVEARGRSRRAGGLKEESRCTRWRASCLWSCAT